MTEKFLNNPIVEEESPEAQPDAPQFLSNPEVFPNQEDSEADSAVSTFFAELAGPTMLGGIRDALEATQELFGISEAVAAGGRLVDIVQQGGVTPEIEAEQRKSLVEPAPALLPEVGEPATLGGQMARDVVQFLTGFVPLFAATGGAGAAALPGVARGVIAGAGADFAVFDPQEERLSNLVAEYPIIGALAANPDDGEIVGRIKNVIEGAVVGGAAEGVMKGLQAAVRSLKGARAAKAVAVGDPDVTAPGKPLEEPVPSVIPPQGEPPGLTAENLLTPLDPDLQTRAAGRTSLFPTREVRVAGNINLDRIDSPEAIKNAVDVIARSEGGFEGARAVGRDAGEAHTRAQRTLLNDSSANLMGDTIRAIGGSDEDKLRFMARLAQHTAIQQQVAGAAAEASARLRTYKEIMTLSPRNIDDIKSALDQVGGGDLAEQKAALLSELDDLAAFNKTAEKIWKPTKLDKVLEWWRAGLLTGFRTHEANFGSNSLVTAYTVPERLVGAAFGTLSGGEKIRFQEAAAFANGAIKAMGKATSDAWQVFWREGPEGFTPESVKSRLPGLKEGEVPTGPSKLDLNAQKRAVEGELGFWVRTPFRGLNAMDMWAKTINFAGESEALAVRRAMDAGHTGAALREETVRILSAMPDDIAEAANKRASMNTFTTPLREQEGVISNLAESMSKFSAKHPSFGFIAPFIKTPANILKFAGERTPAAFFMDDWKKAYRIPGVSRQEALAKVALGTSIMGTAAWYASQGIITGNGPADPATRRIWRQAGNQPYSVLIGGTWYSYARFEPLATLLGIAADTVEIGSKGLAEGEWDDLSMLAIMAAANTLTSKTFMQGPVALIEAINDPRRFGDRFVEMLVGSTVPTVIADVARTVDPALRDSRSVMDAWLNRVPGASGLVEPLLNLWGEEVKREGGRAAQLLSPVYVSTAGKDKISEEMLRVRYAPAMPQRQINGHDLSPEQYSEYVRLSGKGAKEILDRLVGGPEWDELPPFAKIDVMEQVIGEFRTMARGMMMSEHPELSLPRDIQEEFDLTPPAATTGGGRKTSALTPPQADLMASAAGVPSVDRPPKRGKAPKIAVLEKQIDAAGAALAKVSSIGVPDRPSVDGEKMLEIVSEPNRLLTALFEDSGRLPAAEPQAFSAQVQMVQRATDYLTANIPISPDPLGLFNEEPAMPVHERENWDRRVAAVTDPFSVIEDVGNGKIDDVALDAVRNVHPAVFERLQASVVTALVDNKEPVPYERRMIMGDLLGPGLEPTLNPRFIATMQNTFAAPQPAVTALPSRQQLSPSEERQKSENISVAMAESLGGGESLSTPIQEVAES